MPTYSYRCEACGEAFERVETIAEHRTGKPRCPKCDGEKVVEVINVRPTAPDASGNYSDISLTNLFQAHVQIINSERQAIWMRYQSMLIANSIILPLIAANADTNLLFTIVGSAFGLSLCIVWFLLSIMGWNYFMLYSNVAKRFIWLELPPTANPLIAMPLEYDLARPLEHGLPIILGAKIGGYSERFRIKILAVLAIGLFGLLYILLILYSLLKQ